MKKVVKSYNEFINESNVDNQMLRIKMKNGKEAKFAVGEIVVANNPAGSKISSWRITQVRLNSRGQYVYTVNANADTKKNFGFDGIGNEFKESEISAW